MSAIVNDRDVLLQAASVRFVLPTIDPIQIPGLPGAFGDIDQLKDDVEDLGEQIDHLMNTSASFFIRAPALAFFGAAGTTTPSSITLTAERGSGLVGGTIAWTVFAGSATISPSSGDSTTVIGSTVTGRSVTIRARLTIDLVSYDAYATITRFGAVSAVDQVSLTTQVTGQLANSNVTGLGALALLNTVSLNSQVTGALNGLTQVTNLGNLAFVNGLAANQIGAGTLAAGVIYAGVINADQVNSGSFVGKSFTGGIFTGSLFRTAASGRRIEIDATSNAISFYPSSGNPVQIEPSSTSSQGIRISTPSGSYGTILAHNGIGAALSIATAAGQGLRLIVAGHAAILMDTLLSLPAARTEGSICFYAGWLCFANGADWYRCDGLKLT